MVTPDRSVDIHHADRDDSSDSIFVEGEVAAGQAACLMPRRYRKQPEWWVIDVVGVDAPTEDAQGFRLTCSVESLWGTEGIEICGPDADAGVRIARAAGPEKLGESFGASGNNLRSRAKKLRSRDQ